MILLTLILPTPNLSIPLSYRSQLLPGPALPFISSSLRYIGHSEESPWDELPAAVDVATGVRTFRLYGIPIITLGLRFLFREIHLERADPLQVSVGHYPVPGGDKLPSPGTPTPILHYCRTYPRSR